MKTKLPWILLAASIGFNIFFAAGYVRSQQLAERLTTPEGRAEVMAERLSFDEKQMEVLRQVADRLKKEADQAREANRDNMEAFWTELDRGDPDSEKVMDLMDKSEGRLHEYRKSQVRGMIEIARSLKPDQRKQYLNMVRNNTLR